MPGYVLTGTPGAGKTAILRQLEVDGWTVVEEAATDVIALEQAHGTEQPWADPAFVDRIIRLQRQRQERVDVDAGIVVFDRSPVCTLALNRYLGFPASPLLDEEVERVIATRVYEPTVLFVRQQGFVRPTAARRISFEDALKFERVHEKTYRELGFQLVDVPAGPLRDRAGLVLRTIEQSGGRSNLSGP